MTISKEKWKQIEAELAAGLVDVGFRYQGHELSIYRVSKSETTTVLAVYIDGLIKGAWFERIDKLPEDAPKILAEVWYHRTMARYKQEQVANIEKIYGKRRAKKEWPDLHSRIEWIEAYFPKASVLCRQFKKLQGLELIKALCLSEPSETERAAS
ncbi:hypothetical protein JYB87_12645 [Shewanella avicenniae]|uniref:Uncharacterized protein n=1 Tax=Shewanella avicenniae TaxID=2814294 RepID=A0ABX7QPG1_9GAMM|nr:hypothetical protein [Shewanella avicenniae]QSX32601.1 hypothetical protein JYB87_12645 [Shewanella avicenniae]